MKRPFRTFLDWLSAQFYTVSRAESRRQREMQERAAVPAPRSQLREAMERGQTDGEPDVRFIVDSADTTEAFDTAAARVDWDGPERRKFPYGDRREIAHKAKPPPWEWEPSGDISKDRPALHMERAPDDGREDDTADWRAGERAANERAVAHSVGDRVEDILQEPSKEA